MELLNPNYDARGLENEMGTACYKYKIHIFTNLKSRPTLPPHTKRSEIQLKMSIRKEDMARTVRQ